MSFPISICTGAFLTCCRRRWIHLQFKFGWAFANISTTIFACLVTAVDSFIICRDIYDFKFENSSAAVIGSNDDILYLPPLFDRSLWFLKFHVTFKSSSSATVSATKQLKVMLLKAFTRISAGSIRLMKIPLKPAKSEKQKKSDH